MITLEIAFSTNRRTVGLPDSTIGMEIDDSMKSDKSPSRWEEEIFSKISGKIVHIFDRQFVGASIYRALYDDINLEGHRIEFYGRSKTEFVELVNFCINSSDDSKVLICTDIQFGPVPKVYQPMSMKRFSSLFMRFGMRLNSCVEVLAKMPRVGRRMPSKLTRAT